MKKILIVLFIAPIILVSIYISTRYSKNPLQYAPYPYEFTYSPAPIEVESPILIIGDRYGKQLSKFKDNLAKQISKNLADPIKIESLAEVNEGAHRTLQKIKAIKKLPLVIIYLGAGQERVESKFHQEQIKTHFSNFALFENKIISSSLMIEPKLSKLLYTPVRRMKLDQLKVDTTRYSLEQIQNRSMLAFKVFENEVDELYQYIKDKGSYLISVTSPINYELEPIRPCNSKLDKVTQSLLENIQSKTKEKDFKGAYESSKDLALIANTNSNAQFLHAQISLNLGKKTEAIRHFEQAKIYDCSLKAFSPVFNAILKKKARRYEVTVFDFNKMLQGQLGQEPTFLNEHTVQSLYMQNLSTALGLKIKDILKL